MNKAGLFTFTLICILGLVPLSEKLFSSEKWKDLPKANFKWRAIYVHPYSFEMDDETIKKVVQNIDRMGFNAILFYTKVRGVYYNSSIAEKDPKAGDFDPLRAVIREAKKRRIAVYPVVCVFWEMSPTGGASKFLRQHPECLLINKYQRAKGELDWRQHQYIWANPDREKVRQYEKNIIKEIIENYDVDGISLDYIRYSDDYASFSDYSIKKRREFAQKNPHLSETEVIEKFSEMMLVNFVNEVRELLDFVSPKLKLHAYTHPLCAYKFPLGYHSRRASRGLNDVFQSLDYVYKEAKSLVWTQTNIRRETEPAPMIDFRDDKSSERIATEIRIVGSTGARSIAAFCAHMLLDKQGQPEKLDVTRTIAEEFGKQWK